MFKFKSKKPMVKISIARGALETIFDECDQFDVDETGGRIIGSYKNKGSQYEIEVLGVIGPGPSARRTATSFFQDGEYQEKIFRSVEEKYPEIEHLGNWHTHHVNGLSILSSGDRATYQKIVNHDKHNTDFFYAILVVQKTTEQDQRYKVKHYFVQRNDNTVYEIPATQVQIVDRPIIWTANSEKRNMPPPSSLHDAKFRDNANLERVKDQEFFSEFYPDFKPLFSKGMGSFYWKGKLDFIDGTPANIVAIENQIEGKSAYSITITGQKLPALDVLASCSDRTFRSARQAVLNIERDINRELFRKKKD